MFIANYILVLFAFSMFANNGAFQNINKPPLTQIIEKTEERKDFASLAKNNKSVIEAYLRFKLALEESNLTQTQIAAILDAALFSAKKHEHQTRYDSAATPYIIHPVTVAYSILTIGQVSTPEILIAALLHDTVEDTGTTFKEIRQKFGATVEGYVKEVTDDRTLSKEKRKELQLEHAPHKSEGAALIKLADKLYNVTDVHHNPAIGWTKERRDQYVTWASQVVNQLPTANKNLKNAMDEATEKYWSSFND